MANSESSTVDYSSVLDNFCFCYPSKSLQLHKITFEDKYLVLSSKIDAFKKTQVLYNDIIGCRVRFLDLSNGDAARQERGSEILEIYCLSKIKALLGKESRKKVCHSLAINVYESTVKNISVLQYVKEQIELKMRKGDGQHNSGKRSNLYHGCRY